MNSLYKSNYKILQLSLSADWLQAKKNYKRLVQSWHPDKFDDSSTEYLKVHHKFLEITKAYEQLQNYYKKNQRLPFEKHESENQFSAEIETISLSRKKPSSYRRAHSSHSRSKIPLVIGFLLIIYLAYNSSDPPSESSMPPSYSRGTTINPSNWGSSPATLDLNRGHYLSTPGSSVGDVLDNRFNNTRQ